MFWNKKEIIISEDDLSSYIKDTAKNKRIIESIHILINRIADIKNEIGDLEDKLE